MIFCYVLIEEVEHEDLQRDGNNVIYHLWLSFPEAAMGASVEVPTPPPRFQ